MTLDELREKKAVDEDQGETRSYRIKTSGRREAETQTEKEQLLR